MTAPSSAYPRTVDDLMPDARRVQPRDGELVPSVRRLMTALRIGAPKAAEVRERLLAEAARTPQGQREITRDVVAQVETDGTVPAADELVAKYGLDQDAAHLLADVAQLAAQQRADEPAATSDTVAVEPTSKPVTEHGPDADDTVPAPAADPGQDTPVTASDVEASPQHRVDVDTDDTGPVKPRPLRTWPVWVLLVPAFVSVWAGWVGLGERTGYGVVNLLPGFTGEDGAPLVVINTAITLPIGMEVYAAYALYVWLSGRVRSRRTRSFAMVSAVVALVVGASGQIAHHLMEEAGMVAAPWWITTLVSCVPVAVLGMGAALAHLVRDDNER